MCGRPFQGQADVWSEQGRQTVSPEVALGLARGHREPAPPPGLIRFPHKAASVPAQQAVPTMESGKAAGGWHRGPGAVPLQTRPIKLTAARGRLCPPHG